MPFSSVSTRKALEAAAERHGFSVDAVASMLDALRRGNGSMAQFSHAEFSGSGQWMRGGMTMVSDMFNHGLKARVDALCSDLSGLLAAEPEPVAAGRDSAIPSSNVGAAPSAGDWWPSDWGRPAASGSQNGMRYAYFAAARRLAIERGAAVTVYDTLDHRIGGVAQQQSGTGTLAFTSQHGLVDVDALPVIAPTEHEPAEMAPAAPAAARPATAAPATAKSMDKDPAPTHVVALIAQLADLHAHGVLSDAEFGAKKAELLARL